MKSIDNSAETSTGAGTAGATTQSEAPIGNDSAHTQPDRSSNDRTLTVFANKDGLSEVKELVRLERSDSETKSNYLPQVDFSSADILGAVSELGAEIAFKNNGDIPLRAITDLLQDNRVHGAKAIALAGLYNSYQQLAQLSSRGHIFSSSSPEPALLAELLPYSQKKAELQQLSNLEYEKSPEYLYFDKSGDGKLTIDELNMTVASGGKAAWSAENLLKHYPEIANGSEEIDRTSISKFVESQLKQLKDNQPAAGSAIDAIFDTWNRVRRTRADGVNLNLFSDMSEPLNSISPEAIKQGTIGDCYFLASLASEAESNPQLIKDMIRPTADGRFEVKFPGMPEGEPPIIVAKPTEAKLALYNGASEFGTWASVLEEGFGIYRSRSVFRRGLQNISGGNNETEAAGGGGIPSDAMQILSGNRAESYSTWFNSQATMSELLSNAFSGESKSMVVASVKLLMAPRTLYDSFTDSENAMAFGHAYSVLDFQPDGAGGGTVTVRDPSRKNSNDFQDGIMKMPLDKFLSRVSTIYVEQQPGTTPS